MPKTAPLLSVPRDEYDETLEAFCVQLMEGKPVEVYVQPHPLHDMGGLRRLEKLPSDILLRLLRYFAGEYFKQHHKSPTRIERRPLYGILAAQYYLGLREVDFPPLAVRDVRPALRYWGDD